MKSIILTIYVVCLIVSVLTVVGLCLGAALSELLYKLEENKIKELIKDKGD